MIDKKTKEADEKIYECFKKIPLIKYLTPLNTDSEKEKFFSEKDTNPYFKYKTPEKDIFEAEKTLENLKIPESEFRKILIKRKNELLKQIKIIKNLNKENPKTKELSSELYGFPNKKTLIHAKKLLKKTLATNEDYNTKPEEMSNRINKKLKKLGLTDWQVIYSKGKITQTSYNKKIYLPEKKLFSKFELRRLPIHEVEVHAIRFQNSYNQPLKIFIYGFPGFLETEEGLAAFIEEKTKNKNKASFRNYAGRVIAIECLIKQMSFRECFNELKKYNFSDEESWNLCFRVYRGGGFVKDHIYLQGYLSVKDFFKKQGNLKKLFIGKIGINDIEIIKKLEEKNLINKNLVYPNNLKKIIKNAL